MIFLLDGRTAGGGASASRGHATQYRRPSQHSVKVDVRSTESNISSCSQLFADVHSQKMFSNKPRVFATSTRRSSARRHRKAISQGGVFTG
jgi:hypothetical protein